MKLKTAIIILNSYLSLISLVGRNVRGFIGYAENFS